jgi:insulysin
MTLVVYSKMSVDDLENIVGKYFRSIENKDVNVPHLGDPAPYGPENLGKIFKYTPVKDKDIISFDWTLPFVDELDGNHLSYLSILFGHEGENSLLSYLSSRGLASAVGAGG